MPMYTDLKRRSPAERQRVTENLLRLRKQLQRDVPTRTAEDTLLLATWNIRDFDSNKFRHGPRLNESFHYLAEVIAAFDLVAIQEVNQNMAPFLKLMRLLGPNWRFVSTDLTEGRSGNNERLVFIYDRNKVFFKGVAGEIVLPSTRQIGGDHQFARTPFLVTFQSGWFKFSLCSVHLYFGSSSGEGYQRRVQEIDAIAKFLARRAKQEDANFILVGDFNIVSPEDQTMTALKRHKWTLPPQLALKTNMRGDKHYDQIAFKVKRNELQMGPSQRNAGVFNPFRSVFRPADWRTYHQLVKSTEKWDTDRQGHPTDDPGKQKYYENIWRTWQISDHLPLWVELKIDFTEPYLRRVGNRV